MPRVDFYILPEQGSRERFTCDLVTRIRREGLGLHIYMSSRQDAGMMDDLLWTHKDISFVPHALVDDETDSSKVSIGWEGESPRGDEVLVNLSSAIPDFVGNFDRIVEIVPDQDADRQEARQRYRQYRAAGYELHNHDIKTGNESL